MSDAGGGAARQAGRVPADAHTEGDFAGGCQDVVQRHDGTAQE